MMKRLLAITLCIALMLCAASVPALAANATITGSAVSVNAGEEFDFTVSISGNPGLAGFRIFIDCDDSLSVMSSGGELQITQGDATTGGTFLSNTRDGGGWQVLWANVKNSTADGTLFTIRFKAAQNAASGAHAVRLSYSAADTMNVNEELITLAVVDGSVSVAGSGVDSAGQTEQKPGQIQQPGPSAPPAQTGEEAGDSKVFSDLPRGHWAYEYVMGLVARGVVDGVGGDLFDPEGQITRAAFVKLLAVLSGDDLSVYKTCSFKDVADGDWFMPYVAWAKSAGCVDGMTDELFAPNAPVTREQIASVLYRYAAEHGIALPETAPARVFADAGDISDWAAEAVSAMQRAGMIGGYDDGSFRPQGGATRAEASKFVAMFAELMEGKE